MMGKRRVRLTLVEMLGWPGAGGRGPVTVWRLEVREGLLLWMLRMVVSKNVVGLVVGLLEKCGNSGQKEHL